VLQFRIGIRHVVSVAMRIVIAFQRHGNAVIDIQPAFPPDRNARTVVTHKNRFAVETLFQKPVSRCVQTDTDLTAIVLLAGFNQFIGNRLRMSA
jgi:hypothetical protein